MKATRKKTSKEKRVKRGIVPQVKNPLLTELINTAHTQILSKGKVSSEVPFWLPTGIPALDYVINGHGKGLPGGRIIEITSQNEGEGKSTVLGHIMASHQRLGGVVKLYDMECTFDPDFAVRMGVDVDDLLVGEVDCLEDLWDDIEETVKIAAKHPEIHLLIAWDTVAATAAKRELEAGYGDVHVGLHSRIISQACRKVVPLLAVNNVISVFINQTREKIGVMFGEKTTNPGGRALKHNYSVRIQLSRRKSIEVTKDKIKDVVGIQCQAYVRKNKVGKPFRKCTFDIYFEGGAEGRASMFYLAKDLGLMEDAGRGWYTMYGRKFTHTKFKGLVNTDDAFYDQVCSGVSAVLTGQVDDEE